MILTLNQARAVLRAAVEKAGGPEAFAARHPLLTPDKIVNWVQDRGGMPSIQAFNSAGVHVSLNRRANGKVLTVFETAEDV